METVKDQIATHPAHQGTLAVFVDNKPHIHLHCFTSDKEVESGLDGVSELCCHACGDSLYLIYSQEVIAKYPDGVPIMGDMKNTFVGQHQRCADLPVDIGGTLVQCEEFKDICPTYRRNTKTVDISNL